MPNFWYEDEVYQEWLLKKKRKSIIPEILYKELVKNISPDKKVDLLDFGSGSGYVSLYYSDLLTSFTKCKIYACDCNEIYVDKFWHRISMEKRKNICVFYHPATFNISFDNWVPLFDHIICSLTISTFQRPNLFLKTIKPYIKQQGFLHLVDWRKEYDHTDLQHLFLVNHLYELDTIKQYVAEEGYDIQREYSKSPQWYALTLQPKSK